MSIIFAVRQQERPDTHGEAKSIQRINQQSSNTNSATHLRPSLYTSRGRVHAIEDALVNGLPW